MGPAERRQVLLAILCRRRCEIIPNLAAELDVSERTVRRDVDVLSLSYPIYTTPGRHSGGVYLLDGYRTDFPYFDRSQTAVLEKVLYLAKQQQPCSLSEQECSVLSALLRKYTKPAN